MAAQLVIQKGSCWRVGDGSSIRILPDKWIPNHPSNKVLFHPTEEQQEWRVSELIDQSSRCWDKEVVLMNFHKDDVKEILHIPLSCRYIMDKVMWLHTNSETYSVKSRYHVATQVLRNENWAESSQIPTSNNLWAKLWKLRLLNKIKVFRWRVGLNILPTRENLFRCKIVKNNTCDLCKCAPKSGFMFCGSVGQ